jgi:pimeloyl-ACP methyl ester carboxylesterase
MEDGVEQVSVSMVPTNGIELEVATAGPADGTPVVLLHGFPESWHCWRFQIPALVEAGYRVIAPNMRGYGKSSKPGGVRAYRIDALADDIAGLMDHYGLEKAAVVGHDWGAAVTWHFGRRHPDRATCLTVLNCPPGEVVFKTVFSSLAQARRSWYIFVFQLPWLPEWMISRNDFSRLWASMAKTTTNEGRFTEADRAAYLAAWREPGVATAMLNYYRASLRGGRATPKVRKVPVPMRLIWGTADHALGSDMIEPSRDFAEDLDVVRLDGISHWVNVDAPEAVNEALLPWLAQHAAPAGTAEE